MEESPRLQVRTRDGYRGDERPAVVLLDGEPYRVIDIEDAWIMTGVETDAEVQRGFVVRCEGGSRFRLVHSEERGWRGERLPGPHMVKNG